MLHWRCRGNPSSGSGGSVFAERICMPTRGRNHFLNTPAFWVMSCRVFNRTLEEFILLRLRSVSAASQSIGLSQSAASHALAKLRDQLGDPLFTRTGKGVEPTPYGERVGLAARESLDVLRAGLASNPPFDPAKALQHIRQRYRADGSPAAPVHVSGQGGARRERAGLDHSGQSGGSPQLRRSRLRHWVS